MLFLGEVVNGRGAVGVLMGEKAAEWRRDTKTRERLRPYAAAESLGSLAGEGVPCVPATWSVPFEQGGVDWQRADAYRLPQQLLPAL